MAQSFVDSSCYPTDGSPLAEGVLDRIIEKKMWERKDTTFRGTCLFCKHEVHGKREALLVHLHEVHHFSIGHPDNLVHIDEILDHLRSLLSQLQCLYCGGSFGDYKTLRLHMRKKKHFRLNKKHSEYDKYYLINYTQPGQAWQDIQSEESQDDEGTSSRAEDEVWDDWTDDGDSGRTKCLFCTLHFAHPSEALSHMASAHDFDFANYVKINGLQFYDVIKMINYVRRKVMMHACVSCAHAAGDNEALVQHMEAEGHFAPLMTADFWQDVQYMFPTDEEDPMLCHVDELVGDALATDGEAAPVVAEDDAALQRTDYGSEAQPPAFLRPQPAARPQHVRKPVPDAFADADEEGAE